MPKPDLKDLITTNEIDSTVTGRKSGQDISRPIWFVYEENKLYLLPVKGRKQIGTETSYNIQP